MNHDCSFKHKHAHTDSSNIPVQENTVLLIGGNGFVCIDRQQVKAKLKQRMALNVSDLFPKLLKVSL